MMHTQRAYQVKAYDDLDALTKAITGIVWCPCCGFRWNGLLFLNDATGPDGAQEYAVIRERGMVQVESFTVSWMTPEQFKELAARIAEPGWPDAYGQVYNRIEAAEGHHCHLCA
ncbi:MAG: hypothetical protein Q8P22_05830 [Chloroflexota bacterium]|nr:hypothetical protein [Chloroflexota bacterium]